jgi:Zn ribbon nucleic-acid-binding protein
MSRKKQALKAHNTIDLSSFPGAVRLGILGPIGGAWKTPYDRPPCPHCRGVDELVIWYRNADGYRHEKQCLGCYLQPRSKQLNLFTTENHGLLI